MRFAVAMLAALAGGCATQVEPVGPGIDAPAYAMTADDADRNIIASCLDLQRENPRTCLGAVSRVCGDAMGDGAASTAAVVQCAAREERVWNALLVQAVSDLRQQESPSQVALLDAMLAQSEAWTQARCGYAASIYEGGSLARVVSALCVRDTAAERVIDLNERMLQREGG